MDKREYVYVIKGEPIAFSSHYTEKGTWNTYRHLKINYLLQLENQHNSRPKFKGPVDLSIKFYFPIPQKRLKNEHVKPGVSHTENPPIYSLVEFIAALAQESIVSHSGAIASVKASKYYDHDPRVEVEIKEIHEI